MDLHRLRVVEFDTSVREKEREKKYIAELEACKEEGGKTSTVGNKGQIEDENRCLNDNKSPPGLSQKCLDDEVSPPGTSKKYLDDISGLPGTSKKICVNDEITPPRTSKKYLNATTFASHPESSKYQRSKSELFKIPPKKKPRRRALKINSSDIGLKKLFQDSAYSYQKKRTFTRSGYRNARLHHNDENIKEKQESSKKVQYLFARETPSFLRYRKKRTEKETRKKKHDSKFPDDIYGFQKSNRSLDQYQYHMSSFNFLDIDKLPLIKLRGGFNRKPKPPPSFTNCFCKHHAMRVLKSTYGYGLNAPIFYNLGTHRQPRKSRQKTLRVERSCMAKDVAIEVSSSSLSCTSFRDAGAGPSKVKALVGSSHHAPPREPEKSTTLHNVTSANEYNQKPCPCAVTAHQPPSILKKISTLQNVAIPSTSNPCTLCGARTGAAKNECKKKRNKTKKPFLVMMKIICKGLISRFVQHVTDLHTKHHFSRKSFIRYLLFGLLIVVWSPCLLAVILAWVVMFPWKLANILKTDVSKRSFSINNSFKKRFRKKNLRREYQQMCFEDYLPEKKKSFVTTAASWYSRTVGVIAKSFNAVISLLKVNKEPPTRTCSSYFLPHPNPINRYTLFYADQSRRRTRSSANNRIMQSTRCNFRPKCWRKSRCLNLLKTSCPLQSSQPVWPSCTFWNKYAHKYSSKSVPIELSHRRRQLQVNIPSNLFYPRSGVASMSGVEPVITKPFFFNTNETVNNIAHEDAKEHLGQRKSGTQLVFNYICGTQPPQTTNLETFRARKFGSADKNLNITAKCSTKHDVASALDKALACVHRITSLTDSTNSMANRKLNRLREQSTVCQIPLNCPSVGNKKLAITNNKSRPLQNKIVKLLPTKQEYKFKTIKTRAPIQKHPTPAQIKSNVKHDIILNYSLGNKLKQYKPHRIPVATQMLSKIADITTMTNRDVGFNYCGGVKHEQSKHCYGHKPHKIPVATQEQLSTANITTGPNRNVALDCPCKQNRGLSKLGYKHKPHQIPVATEMQSRTADNATDTNRDVVLNRPFKENHKLSQQGYKHKPHQIPVASEMQSRTADNATNTNRDVALKRPFKENHELSQHSYKHKPHRIPATTQVLDTANITTIPNRDVSLKCPCGEKKEHCYGHKPQQIPVATQKQLSTVNIMTGTNHNALNCPCKQNRGLSKLGYKHKPDEISVATQMQSHNADNATATNWDVAHMLSNTADITRMTNRNVVLKCPCEEKQEQSKHCYGHKPHQIPVATQKQLSTANITTSTNRNVASNFPCKQNRGLSKLGYKHKPDEIPVATQMQSRTADNATDTNRDIALNYPDSIKPSPANKCIPSEADKDTLCIPSTADKDTISTQKKTGAREFISKKQDKSIQKESYRIDASVNCVSDYDRSKTKEIFRSKQTVSPTEIIFEQQVDQNIFAQYASKSQSQAFEQNLNTFLRDSFSTSQVILANSTETKPLKKTPSQISPRVGSMLETRCSSTTQPLSTKQFQTEELIKQVTQVSNVQANSQHLKIASDCDCGVSFQTVLNKQTGQIALEADGYPKLAQHLSSLEPDKPEVEKTLLKFPKPQERLPPKMSQKTSTLFGMASDCRCGGASPTGQVPNKQTGQTTLEADDGHPKLSQHLSSLEPDKTEVEKTLLTFPKPQERLPPKMSQKTSTLFGMASDCRCGGAFPTGQVPNKQTGQTTLEADDGHPKLSQHLSSLEPNKPEVEKTLLKFPKPQERLPSKMSQKTSTLFGMASDCRCGEPSQTGHVPNKQTGQTSLEPNGHSKFLHHIPSLRTDIPKVDKTLSGFPESPEHLPTKRSQANSPLFGTVSHCSCGVASQTGQVSNKAGQTELEAVQYCRCQQSEPIKEVMRKEADSKNKNTYTGSPKELSKQSNLTQTPSRTLQEQSKSFGSVSDCVCGTNQPTTAEKGFYNKVTGSKSPTAKKTDRSPLLKSLPHKCRCPVLQDSIGKQPYGTKVSIISSRRKYIVKVDKTRSKYPESHVSPKPKPRPRKCRCSIESLQDFVDEQPYGTKVRSIPCRRKYIVKVDKTRSKNPESPDNSPISKSLPRKFVDEQRYGNKVSTTSSERDIAKVKSRSKYSKSSKRSPPPKSLSHECPCPVGIPQNPVGKKSHGTKVSTSSSSRKHNAKVGKTRSKNPKSPDKSPISKPLLRKSVDEQHYGNKVSTTSSERDIAKVKPRSKYSKSSERSPPPKSLSRECLCPVGSPQNPVGKQFHGPKVSESSSCRKHNAKVSKTRSNYLESPLPQSFLQKCMCSGESLQDPVRNKPTRTKVNIMISKRNSAQVDQTLSKSSKLSKHTPPQEYLNCACPLGNLHDLEGKKPFQTSQKSVFSRKSKRDSFGVPHECPCSALQNDLNKISLKSDVSVNWNTTKRSFIRSCGRTESTRSANETSSRFQSNRMSQCSSKVSSLVMSLRSKLFSRKKSKQTKIPDTPTTKPKTIDKRDISIDDILESMLDDVSKRSLFRRNRKSNISQNQSLPTHSNHSSSSCLICKSSWRQCTKNIRKPLIVDKSYSCLHNVTKTFQRPSFLSHSSKYECRSQSICQQSKTSEHSSIVTLFARKPHSKSPQKKPSKKFAPQYSSSLINHQATPTAQPTAIQTVPSASQIPPGQRTSLLNRPQPKPLIEKIRSITTKISTNSRKYTQEKVSSTISVSTALIYVNKCTCWPNKLNQLSKKISQLSRKSLENISPSTAILPGDSADGDVHKTSRKNKLEETQQPEIDALHGSSPPKQSTEKINNQFDSIPQQTKAEKNIPNVSRRCKCAGDQKNITNKHLSNNKLIMKQFDTIPQQPKTEQLKQIISETAFGTDGQPKFTQHILSAQPNITTIGSLHRRSQSKQFTKKVDKQINAMPQQPRIEQVIPIISDRCRCARGQNITTKHLLNNRLQLNSDLQKLPTVRPIKNKISNNSYSLPFDNYNQRFQSPSASHHVVKTQPSGMEHKIVQRSSEISHSPRIQQYSKIYVYQQNTPDQKKLSQIPKNLDNPPPGLLQPKSHSPGYGRKRKTTAQRGVRQPYPDFNRVSMRYPGHTQPQQLRRPTKNYPPAPGATPPRNYTCDPCFANPHSKCALQSPFDESALRRAYKRRPLRYTPPREQLQRVVMTKKLRKHKKKAAKKKRKKSFFSRKENIFQCLRRVTKETERKAWPTAVTCDPMWLNTLKRKPCFFIYKLWPRVYPAFLNLYKTQQYICQMLVYFITLCFWSPLLLCCYMCCSMCECGS